MSYDHLSANPTQGQVVAMINRMLSGLLGGPLSPAKKLVDFKATTDLWTNVTLAAGGWNQISGAVAPTNIPTFTVSPGAAFVVVTLAMGVQVNSTVASWLASGVWVDGALAASLGSMFTPASPASPLWLNGGSVLIPMAPGLHSIEPRVYASSAATGLYLRAASAAQFEFLRLGAVEVH